MKKIVKIITIIMIIVIVICGIYYALNKNYFKKKKAVEDDEKNYGEEYMEFKSAVYKEKPERIIIKKQGTANEFYIFDKSNLVQYEINPGKGEIKVVGNKDKKGIVYKNGQEEEIGVYTLNNEKVTFTENYDAYKEIDYDQIFLTSNGAVYVKDGVFYKVYNNYLKNPIYLFEAKNVQDIKVKEDNIYYINDQFLYRYNDYGNVRILKREQFKYDYTNIYDVYFEE